MKKLNDNSTALLYIKTFLIFAVVTLLSVFMFGIVLFFLEKGYEYSSVLGTIAVAIGTFAAAFYLAKKKAKKGMLIGFIVGILAFLGVTLVSLLVDDGGVTLNTLFKFFIITLSSLIGGVMGVNKKENRNYI